VIGRRPSAGSELAPGRGDGERPTERLGNAVFEDRPRLVGEGLLTVEQREQRREGRERGRPDGALAVG
jgi:hypothetical protein